MSPAKQFRACPLCGNPVIRELYRFEPARVIPGRVVRCVNCRCIYKRPSDNAKPIEDYYRDPRYHELDYWSFEGQAESALRKILDTMLSVLSHDGSRSLLEIGCGPGQFLKMAQEAGFDVSGVDLNSANAAEAANRTGATVMCDDFLTMPIAQRFDVIAMLDLIEHLPEPMEALRRSYELLNPGGHIVLYTPNHSGITVRVADWMYRLSGHTVTRPITEIFDCLHVVFFDEQSLRWAVERSNFRVVKATLSPYDPARNNQATRISAMGVRVLESLGSALFGQFRLLMLGQKPLMSPELN